MKKLLEDTGSYERDSSASTVTEAWKTQIETLHPLMAVAMSSSVGASKLASSKRLP